MTTPDINHPRALLLQWRGEADRLDLLPDDLSTAPIHARKTTLRQCADELENRLIWSGLS